jgi:HAD superfamily hydrolase (TIGR01509 family)
MPDVAPPSAVLFDFDGVLADTESIHVAAWERTFTALGWDVPPATCARAAEQDDRVFLAEVFHSRGIRGGDVAGWVARKQQLTRMLLADTPRLFPGIEPLIQTLSEQGRTLAVVSSTWRENIVIVLAAARLVDRFTLIISKEDVTAVKPAADGYLLALKRLKLSPYEAIAIEDSPSGLQAASAAGLRVLIAGHRHPAGPWLGKADYVPDLANLAVVLPALGFGAPCEHKTL